MMLILEIKWFNKIFRINGFNFLGLILIVDNKANTVLINHERIHTAQYRELWIIGFLVLYAYEYFRKLLKYRNHMNAYINIVFEREAYHQQDHLSYLIYRKRLSFRQYYNDACELTYKEGMIQLSE